MTRELFKREKNLLRLLAENQGYYDAENEKGERIGKLVGYAGTYDTSQGPKHYVGTRYWNFPRGAERNPEVLQHFIWNVLNSIHDSAFDKNMPMEIDCTFGCPEGGILPAFEFACEFGCFFSRADKKVIEAATSERREKSELIFGRHTVESGWKIAIVEDVVNNMSTTDKAIRLVESMGATVVAIICMVNRSPSGRYVYEYNGREIEIISAVTIPTKEYRQDDPAVSADITANRIIWKPKNQWRELTAG